MQRRGTHQEQAAKQLVKEAGVAVKRPLHSRTERNLEQLWVQLRVKHHVDAVQRPTARQRTTSIVAAFRSCSCRDARRCRNAVDCRPRFLQFPLLAPAGLRTALPLCAHASPPRCARAPLTPRHARSRAGGATAFDSHATPSAFWTAVWRSYLVILCLEIGDRTFFIAALMSAKHPAHTVFIGAFGALLVMTVLSAALGVAAPLLLPRAFTHWAGALPRAYYASGRSVQRLR